MAPSRKLGTVQVGVASLAACWLLAGCGNLLEDLAFVLSANYSGPFVVIEDPNSPEIPRENGAYTIDVPESGVVRVQSAAIFFRDTDQSAIRGASELPLEGHQSSNQIALHRGSYSGGPIHVFFVGTRTEFEQADLTRVQAVEDRLVWPEPGAIPTISD